MKLTYKANIEMVKKLRNNENWWIDDNWKLYRLITKNGDLKGIRVLGMDDQGGYGGLDFNLKYHKRWERSFKVLQALLTGSMKGIEVNVVNGVYISRDEYDSGIYIIDGTDFTLFGRGLWYRLQRFIMEHAGGFVYTDENSLPFAIESCVFGDLDNIITNTSGFLTELKVFDIMLQSAKMTACDDYARTCSGKNFSGGWMYFPGVSKDGMHMHKQVFFGGEKGVRHIFCDFVVLLAVCGIDNITNYRGQHGKWLIRHYRAHTVDVSFHLHALRRGVYSADDKNEISDFIKKIKKSVMCARKK